MNYVILVSKQKSYEGIWIQTYETAPKAYIEGFEPQEQHCSKMKPPQSLPLQMA